jgi:plasmid stability protein
MALLQVRNFPDDTYEEISKMAKKERRSIAQQTIMLLEKALEVEETPRERMVRALERTMAREVPEWLKGIDSAASIREDRDR